MDNWIDVNDRIPDKETKVWFWLVPMPPEECPCNTSGDPITLYGRAEPYMEVSKWSCWSGLMKPTHWQPLPKPPGTETEFVLITEKP